MRRLGGVAGCTGSKVMTPTSCNSSDSSSLAGRAGFGGLGPDAGVSAACLEGGSELALFVRVEEALALGESGVP